MSAITLTEPAGTAASAAVPGERGKPIGTFAGLPLYKTGTAPAHLRSRSQLERGLRLRPTAGPICYIKPTWHPDERRALFDPADATPIPFRTLGDEWAWWSRRTCPRCGKRREYILNGEQCGVCQRADRAKAQARAERTCSDCRRRGEKPYPLYPDRAWYQVRLCRFCVAKRNRLKEDLLRAAIRCKGGCGRRTATKREVLAWALETRQAIARWERRCLPCQAAHDAEQARLKAEREARWAREHAEHQARELAAREARAREVADLAAWAREALDDPNVVILDTETTGLEDDARIVDIAVVTAAGEVMLDTLVNPGEPIPASATAIHGITDEMVAGAPTFTGIAGQLAAVLAGRRVIIYNKTYDVGILAFELRRLFADAGDGREAMVAAWMAQAGFEDAMEPYSDWVGEWNDYHGHYRWQRLNGGHRALGDCLAVIECLRVMARDTGADEEEAAA